MASSLEQQLVSGGLTAAAAKAIANAVGNLATAQQKASTQLVDGTPAEKLRLIGPEARRSYFANLDQPRDQRFADRLEASTQGFESREVKHSYDSAEPRTTTSRLNKASVVGGDYINVATVVESEVQQSKIDLDVQGSGRHLRLNAARDRIEAVDFVATNDTDSRISNEWVERNGATVLQSKARGLTTQAVVLGDGSAMPCTGWFNATPPLEQIFSAWVKANVLDAGNKLDFANGFVEYGTWRPFYTVAFSTAATAPTLPADAYYASDNVRGQSGYYIRIGHFVFAWFDIRTYSTRNGLAVSAPSAWTSANTALNTHTGLVVGGLPYGYTHTTYGTGTTIPRLDFMAGGVTANNFRSPFSTSTTNRKCGRVFVNRAAPQMYLLDTAILSPNTASQVEGVAFTAASALITTDTNLQLRQTECHGWVCYTSQNLDTYA